MRHSVSLIVFILTTLMSTPAFCEESSVAPSEQTSDSKDEVNQILYLMHAGHTEKAIDLYKEYSKNIGHHDFDLIQRIGLILLDQGYRSRTPEVQLLTLFGAGVSANEKALYIVEDSLNHTNPQIQLIGMSFITQYQSDHAEEALRRAMASPYLIIRLEAAFHLAEKKSPSASGQIEALMYKTPPEILPLFPQLFAMVGNTSSIKILRRLLAHSDENVRVAAILSTAEFNRDDLLPQIRKLASQHGALQQEACATALGDLKDESSVAKLETLSQSSAIMVKLAALHALYDMGRKEVRSDVESLARAQNLFAIAALGKMPGSEPLLMELVTSDNNNVRINASLALLELRNPRCLSGLVEILIKDPRDLAFARIISPGSGLAAWKVIPSSRQNLEDNPVVFELSLHMRESALKKALELPEKDVLKLATLIFEREQNDLVPTLVSLLENIQTPEAIALLKKFQQKAGAPLIRNYCNLVLYRLKVEGPYSENLRQWVTKQQDEDLIRFRTFIPWEMREKEGSYQLTPQETSRLLVDAFDAFATMQDDKGVDIILEAIKNGNPKNKYALAGLLIHAAH